MSGVVHFFLPWVYESNSEHEPILRVVSTTSPDPILWQILGFLPSAATTLRQKTFTACSGRDKGDGRRHESLHHTDFFAASWNNINGSYFYFLQERLQIRIALELQLLNYAVEMFEWNVKVPTFYVCGWNKHWTVVSPRKQGTIPSPHWELKLTFFGREFVSLQNA